MRRGVVRWAFVLLVLASGAPACGRIDLPKYAEAADAAADAGSAAAASPHGESRR